MEVKLAIFTYMVLGLVYMAAHIGLKIDGFNELLDQVVDAARPLGPLVGSFVIASAFAFCVFIWPYLLCKKVIRLFKEKK
jgi:uncharacterized membrane protein YdjX (TVP38/TMEM64 family)